MGKKDKSLLENMQIKEKGFPLSDAVSQAECLEIVSLCKTCGAPIYGKPKYAESVSSLACRYSCKCWDKKE